MNASCLRLRWQQRCESAPGSATRSVGEMPGIPVAHLTEAEVKGGLVVDDIVEDHTSSHDLA